MSRTEAPSSPDLHTFGLGGARPDSVVRVSPADGRLQPSLGGSAGWGEPGGRCHCMARGWLLQQGSAGMWVAAPWGVSWPHFRAYSQSVGCLGLTDWTGRQARGALGLSLSSRFLPPGSSQGSSIPKRRAEAAPSWRPRSRPTHAISVAVCWSKRVTHRSQIWEKWGDTLWSYLIYQARPPSRDPRD